MRLPVCTIYKGNTMKRIICLLLTVVLLLSLCACAKESKNVDATDNTKSIQTKKINAPKPITITTESSENKLGARYTFTLQQYNDMLNDACKKMSDDKTSEYFVFENWNLMSNNLTDDNGVKYETYCYATDMLTITAAVEKQSKKIMNISCGAPYEQFEDGDENFQYNVILTSAILAMVAGGYDEDALEFLYSIFYDSAKNKEKFFYEDIMYMMDYSKSEGDVSVVLFMTSPCTENIKTEWKLVDYSTFEGSYTEK